MAGTSRLSILFFALTATAFPLRSNCQIPNPSPVNATLPASDSCQESNSAQPTACGISCSGKEALPCSSRGVPFASP